MRDIPIELGRRAMAVIQESPRFAMKIRIKDFQQLRQICWNRRDDAVIDGEEALALYERNWRFVDRDAMTDEERALIDQLVEAHGNGVLMVD